MVIKTHVHNISSVLVPVNFSLYLLSSKFRTVEQALSSDIRDLVYNPTEEIAGRQPDSGGLVQQLRWDASLNVVQGSFNRAFSPSKLSIGIGDFYKVGQSQRNVL